MSGRIRTFKPEILEDDKTAALSDKEMRVFKSVILLADDYGNFRAQPSHVHVQIYWSRPKERIEDTEAALDELARVGLISIYVVRGQRYGHVTNWDRHQKVSHPGKPRVPPPSDRDALPHEPTAKPKAPRKTRIQESLPRTSGESPENLRRVSTVPDPCSGDSPGIREECLPDLRPPTKTTTTDPEGVQGEQAATPLAATALPAMAAAPPAGESGPPRKKSQKPDVVADVYEHFLDCKQRHNPRAKRIAISDKDRKALRVLLDRGADVEDLKLACEGLFLSPHHLGENDRDTPYLELQYVLRENNRQTFVDLALDARAERAASVAERELAKPPEGAPVPPPAAFLERLQGPLSPKQPSLLEQVAAADKGADVRFVPRTAGGRS